MGFLRPPLPGVYFDPPARAGGAGLPPLDVAGFVGFAARGPVDLPVAVEDLSYFRAVFGGELALARTSGGATVFANLPRTLESFFANGGRRAYAVRLTGESARPGRFRIPGLIADHGDGPVAASIEAASPGRWSSTMRLAASVDAVPLPTGGFRWAEGALELRDPTGTALAPGDVLRAAFENGGRWLIPISELEPRPDGWRRLALGPAWPLLSPDRSGTLPEITDVRLLTTEGARPLTSLAPAAWLRSGLRWVLTLAGVDDIPLRPGDLLRLSLGDSGRLLFPVKEVRVANAGSPPTGFLVATARDMLAAAPGGIAALPPAQLCSAERLRFALAIGRTNIGLTEDVPFDKVIDDLAFNAAGRRFWGDVVWLESSPLFRSGGKDADQRNRDSASWFRTVLNDGWSLPGREATLDPAAFAGRLAPTPAGAKASVFLPLGMADLLPDNRDDGWTVIRPDAEGDDGLDTLDPAALVDRTLVPDLSTPPTGAALLAAAEARHYAQGRRLRGLHSLMLVDELATIALPEAAQPGWIKLSATSPAATPSVAPTVSPPPAANRAGFGPCEAPRAIDLGTVAEPPAPTEPDLPYVFENDGSALLNRVLDLHLALLAICHARRDLTALFSLPRDFEARHCLEWRDRLTARLRGGTFGDAVDATGLSYCAVHHPWLVLASGERRAVPPEGAVAGIYARRERTRGVWVSPSNEQVYGVIDVTQQLSAADWAELFEAQVNLVRRGVRDFRLMSAHTLSRERSLLQVSVRRLLILLRRLALRRGLDYAFESNHERFREAVRVEFEAVLTRLFERGAFAGRIPEEAFRVVTDESVNPPESVDQGRLVAQIQIAPSQPLEFLIVRLARLADGLLHAVEPS